DIMKKILPLITALFFALAFIGCNNNVSNPLAGGTYTGSVEAEGMTYSMTFTFNANSTFTAIYSAGGQSDTTTGVYSVNGDTASLTATSGGEGTRVITTTDGWQHFVMAGEDTSVTFTRQ
ncbi:MAG: lipocalin family protein, partial [Treponema sp.]|nr:lipocalin family protein [Treponema sp.]